MKLDDFARPVDEMGFLPHHVRVASGRSNIGRREGTVLGAERFFSPPFACGGMSLRVDLDVYSHGITLYDSGDSPIVPNPKPQLLLQSETWHPSYLHRTGTFYGYLGDGRHLDIMVESWLVPAANDDAFFLRTRIVNRDTSPVRLRACVVWESPSVSIPGPAAWGWGPPENGVAAERVGTGEFLADDVTITTMWSGHHVPTDDLDLELDGGEAKEAILKVALRTDQRSIAEHVDLGAELCESLAICEERWARIWDRVPHLETEHDRLLAAYNHSVLSYYFCVWDSPHFIHEHFVSESGIDGGAVCNYLWGAYNGARIRAVVEGEKMKLTIRAYLAMDTTAHYAYEPLTGAGVGPCYSYNEISLIHLVKNYVEITGDRAFLAEDFEGVPIYRKLWEVVEGFEAAFESNGELLDFGWHHNLTEMRTSGYEHIVFSPNAERVGVFTYLADVVEQFGHHADAARFRGKATAIATEVQSRLWDEDAGWFRNLHPDGQAELVYSVQMYDLLTTGTLDSTQRDAVLRHLGPEGFLSKNGVHSVSKADLRHFDIGDVDWGGSGAFAGDPGNLIEDLFHIGEVTKAWEVTESILWWSERYPYWPQVLFATKQDYSHIERPNVQAAFSFAQAIVFGMFGLHRDAEGDWNLSERLPSPLSGARLTNLPVNSSTTPGEQR